MADGDRQMCVCPHNYVGELCEEDRKLYYNLPIKRSNSQQRTNSNLPAFSKITKNGM